MEVIDTIDTSACTCMYLYVSIDVRYNGVERSQWGREVPMGSRGPNGVERSQWGREVPMGSRGPNGVKRSQWCREVPMGSRGSTVYLTLP